MTAVHGEEFIVYIYAHSASYAIPIYAAYILICHGMLINEINSTLPRDVHDEDVHAHDARVPYDAHDAYSRVLHLPLLRRIAP